MNLHNNQLWAFLIVNGSNILYLYQGFLPKESNCYINYKAKAPKYLSTQLAPPQQTLQSDTCSSTFTNQTNSAGMQDCLCGSDSRISTLESSHFQNEVWQPEHKIRRDEILAWAPEKIQTIQRCFYSQRCSHCKCKQSLKHLPWKGRDVK